ncbi:MAG: hypothetical protein CVV24_05470, partial [Ignavibacteriae bacterium HGW-Ignavibacteriae-3]
ALTLIVRFSLESYALLLTTSDRLNVRLYTVIFATLLNLSLNFFLIPAYGAFGAAIVSLVTNIFVGVVYYAANLKLVTEYLSNTRTMIFVLFSFAVGWICWLVRDISVLITAPVAGLIILFFAYTMFFTKEERVLILSREFNFSFFNNK